MAISKIITSSLTDDAVTSAKIGTDQVGADALSSSAISGAVDIPANSVGESELSVDYTAQSVPHIIPGVLHPAYNDKKLDGTALAASTTGPAGSTVTSSKYGTVQSDGRMYYYTEIKGSKPIKDPRIGAYFGSQRHTFSSLQILEQETATHGADVASVDGREWIRTCGKIGGTSDPVHYRYDAHGTSIMFYRNGTGFLEITGYFNDVNFLNYTAANRGIQYYLDGGSANGTHLGTTSVGTPLNARYVDAGSLVNLGLSTSLGIHTIKIKSSTSDDTIIYGIELIAQDTSSTANRSKIQIPAQNVVSFGKKFSISATAVHYDPFTTMSYGGSGTTTSALGNLIDTATSLGMDNWKAGGDNFHRPWNGGRVIKWVDSDGTIKTSVTMMPPNAQNMSATASNAVSNTEVVAGTNAETINFDTTTIANASQLHEVAKTFHFREFGNGSANAGTNAGSYRDASMLSGTANNIAFAMDDGLTSLSALDVKCATDGMYANDATSDVYVTFIGTGIARSKHNDSSNTEDPMENLAQNLPYGTHILKLSQDSSTSVQDITLDGVLIKDGLTSATYQLTQLSFYQPKKPPIPEDCVVLADYMLMADYVAQTGGTAPFISKGVRRNNASRDLFYDASTGGTYFSLNAGHSGGFQIGANASRDANVFQANLPAFATRIDSVGYADRRQIFVDGGSAETQTVNGSAEDAVAKMSNAQSLGLYTFKSKNKASTDGTVSAIDIATPIHTSSHYQSFESPFLHELVGGDRNMEQTNLVCTPDGKTWDQLTRDTSYIGTCQLSTNLDSGVSNNTVVPMIWWRGNGSGGAEGKEYFNKDFAIGYDRMICLVAGQYELTAGTIAHGSGTGGDHAIIKVNGIGAAHQTTAGSGYSAVTAVSKINLNRGDYVQIFGKWHGGSSAQYNHVLFTRI